MFHLTHGCADWKVECICRLFSFISCGSVSKLLVVLAHLVKASATTWLKKE